MKGATRYLLVAAVAALAAVTAMWLGRSLPVANHGGEGRLHEIMHEQLELDAGQEKQIEMLEARFAQQRKALDAEMRKANVELARAVADEHAYGTAVEHAVDRSHMAMGELQKVTLRHVFAMREVLRPDQAQVFDKAVQEALVQAPQD